MVLRAIHVWVISTFAVLNCVKENGDEWGVSFQKNISSSITVVLSLGWQAFALRRLLPMHF